jgi:hypothetical protein
MIGDYIGVVLDYVGLTLQETLTAVVVLLMVLMLGKVGKR